MSDLLFVSLEAWDEVWRRNQFLVSGWARQFPRSRVLFVTPPQRVGRGARAFSPQDLPNVRVVCPPKLLPESWQSGRVVNRRALRMFARREARRWGLQRPLLWLNPYDAGHLRRRMNERGTIYDITDDWELAESDASRRARIQRFDRALCRRADLTVVCSQALFESRREVARRCLLLPNGVDAAHYASAQKLNGGSSEPVFGYTGTLHPSRVDAELILELARAYPHGRVELVGPDFLDDTARELLKRAPNVGLRGPVAYRELPLTMRDFDVCIVPHRESAFVESLNPIKLWEYLASGKPVASTNVAGFRDYAPLCHIGSGRDGFLEACEAARREAQPSSRDETDAAQERSNARRAIAEEHSWNARLQTLLCELNALGLIKPELP